MAEPTPRLAAEFLAELPAYLPPRHERLPDGLTVANVTTGDMIAVCRRWMRINACTSVNGWVTIRLDSPNVEGISAKETLPVHLARKESSGADAAVAPGV